MAISPSNPLFYPSIALDGDFGKYTRQCLQRWLKYSYWYTGVIDGNFGSMSVKALQTWMKQGGWYTRAVDGQAGKYTWYAFFDALNKGGFWDPGAITKSGGKLPGAGLTLSMQHWLNRERTSQRGLPRKK